MRLARQPNNAKQPTLRFNFSGPESLMKVDNEQRNLVYGYNAQAEVDGHAQGIVGAQLTQEETDHRMVLPMVAAVEEAMGVKPAAITAAAG